jgi:uncharacterized protein (DUF4415 family)
MSDNAMNKHSRTDWERLVHMQDDEIDQRDIPTLGEDFFERARIFLPSRIAENTVRLDADIAAWFKAQGKEYTTIINDVLRSYIETHEK